jgi:UDP-N-acetylmuramoyl-tripeptide--D-alanyl-D-alanine ligase
MIPLPLDELRGLGELDADAPEVTGVQIDSRRVRAGELFVAVRGGRAYLGDARARGAATLVPDDDFAAMAAIGRAVRARIDARVVAITGSVGKTSTKDILAALLRAAGASVVAAEDGFNNEIGLPLTLTRVERDTDVVVTEMGMRGPGQIRALAEIARPYVGLITSIAPVHLELLGSIENIARAKAELLEVAEIGLVPADEPLLAGYDARRFTRPEVEIRDGHAVVDGVELDFAARHQAANAGAALAVLDVLGYERPRGVVHVEFSRWRSQETELPGGGLLINDAWNANPVAMRAALAHLRERAAGRRTVAVLGEMAELGGEAARFHEEIGSELGSVDVVIGVGELARSYRPAAWAATAAEAVPLVRGLVQPGDAVLVKGSRSVGLEVVAEALA